MQDAAGPRWARRNTVAIMLVVTIHCGRTAMPDRKPAQGVGRGEQATGPHPAGRAALVGVDRGPPTEGRRPSVPGGGGISHRSSRK